MTTKATPVNLARIFLAIFVVVGLIVAGRNIFIAPLSATGWALVAGWVVVQVLLIWLVVRRHPGRPVNPWFFWLGLVAGGAAGGVTQHTNSVITGMPSRLGQPDFVAWLLTPTGEETAKWLAVLLLALGIITVRRPIEAAVLGIAVGGGFSMFENSIYIASAELNSLTSDTSGAVQGYLARAVACPFGHSIYTGLAAWGVGCFIVFTHKSLSWRIGQLIGWFAFAYVIHAIYNSLPEIGAEISIEAEAVSVLASLILQWVLAIWLYLRSRKIGARTQPV